LQKCFILAVVTIAIQLK